jgi:hypothetical protein
MRCRDREALDLLAVSHVIDVRLLKVLAFGKNAASASPPFTLRDRTSYHITNWVATALWNVDDHAAWENGRWRIRLSGRLVRDAGAEISHSFAEPGMALMVCTLTTLEASDISTAYLIRSTMCAFSRSVQMISGRCARQTEYSFMARFPLLNNARAVCCRYLYYKVISTHLRTTCLRTILADNQKSLSTKITSSDKLQRLLIISTHTKPPWSRSELERSTLTELFLKCSLTREKITVKCTYALNNAVAHNFIIIKLLLYLIERRSQSFLYRPKW